MTDNNSGRNLDINLVLNAKKFKIIAKPNSKESRLEGFDERKNAYRISIKAKAEDNKANIELIKFLSKLLRKRVKITAGFKSREKLVELE